MLSRRSAAAFADPALVEFVRPGLVARITTASVAQDGTIQVQFTLADPKGLPLDRLGITTPGPVAISFIAAYLPQGQNDYTAYTTRSATNAGTGLTVQQPAADSGGVFTQTGDGAYTYTFGKKLPSGFDATATHTIGFYATRNLSEFNLDNNYADGVFSFVPNGSAVTRVHDEVRTASCNKCHDPLEAHGGPRQSVALCVLCHQPQNVDPDTGNTLDMKVFIHKIHMGSSLPTVQAGTPYQIIGFNNSVNDYSNVVFPADVRNCTYCHEGGIVPPNNSGQPGQGGLTSVPGGAACGSPGNPGCDPDEAPFPAASVDYWTTHPSRAACGACHDNVNFASGENHVNLPEISDNQCAQCHILQGELPFDASIVGAHTIPAFSPGLPGVVFGLVKVDNGAAGQSPTVTYTLADKSGNPLLPSQMDSLSLILAGPTSDYQTEVSEDVRTASTGQSGTYSYTFKAAVPAGATGTYTIGIEGYKNVVILPGTVIAQTVRDAGFNQVINFSVDGSTVAPHPVEIAQANCNSCHFALSAHGGFRQNVQYCLVCHNPTATDASVRPAAQAPAQSIDLPVLIHRLHFGDEGTALAADEPPVQFTPFIIYGFRGSVNDFSDVRFPGDLKDCAKCHVNDSQQLPVPATRIAVNSPRAFINPAPPITAACTACHIELDASAHASTNTSPTLGEACAVCHGPDAAFSVDAVHSGTLLGNLGTVAASSGAPTTTARPVTSSQARARSAPRSILAQ
jgi:hypothetical protein